ncbi:MAG: hypothetical protein AAF485_30535 [Chloroflexota bacterium]
MERPTSITVLSVVFGWLTFAGIGNSIAIFSGVMPYIPRWFGVLALIYGVAAFLSATRLWRMEATAITPIRVWMIVCVAIMLFFTARFQNMIMGGWAGGLGFLVFLVPFFWWLHNFVTSQLHRGTSHNNTL